MVATRVWERSEPIVRGCQTSIILVAGVSMILWVSPITRGWLSSISLFDENSIIAVVGASLVLTFGASIDL